MNLDRDAVDQRQWRQCVDKVVVLIEFGRLASASKELQFTVAAPMLSNLLYPQSLVTVDAVAAISDDRCRLTAHMVVSSEVYTKKWHDAHRTDGIEAVGCARPELEAARDSGRGMQSVVGGPPLIRNRGKVTSKSKMPLAAKLPLIRQRPVSEWYM